MPAPEPPHDSTRDSAKPPCNPAAAATEMIWACALATAHATIASTARGLEVWSQMMRPLPAPPPEPVPEEAAPTPPSAGEDAKPSETVPEPAPAAAAQPSQEEAAGFASYRSSSGHAAAQVTVSE